ncbi:Regulator of chromosome condensation (RCC1) repeat [Carpediemonas membranifera]|uniref:Regulator of chromosome condensation (RCC1) repeat n=1 Tax=Carpediemonas membranifera TaxID=201153 RepID=A0A8J6B2V2_9EUKA|nr:Regulator of chromosome condensation (RCC1) repeat [Carpediemonas membranifera]|eukprot:KAG9394533.1 Regulator of chromosome condensation (RCC1) repeat [Carpediemonas membranifera]
MQKEEMLSYSHRIRPTFTEGTTTNTLDRPQKQNNVQTWTEVQEVAKNADKQLEQLKNALRTIHFTKPSARSILSDVCASLTMLSSNLEEAIFEEFSAYSPVESSTASEYVPSPAREILGLDLDENSSAQASPVQGDISLDPTTSDSPAQATVTLELSPEDEDMQEEPRGLLDTIETMAAEVNLESTRRALATAYHLAVKHTQTVSGDLPSLLKHAYRHQFGGPVPADDASSPAAFNDSIEGLCDAVATLTVTNHRAAVMIKHARRILTSGPRLSMNIPLLEGEELPDRLYTLLQGTIWAILLQAGADPVLFIESHKDYEPEAKCLWFLCRKFFFSFRQADKDGVCHIAELYGKKTFTRHYAGRVFARGANENKQTGVAVDDARQIYLPQYRRVHVPPVVEIYVSKHHTIAVTPRGLYGWGIKCGLGMGSQRFGTLPARLTFAACPFVAKYEASLPMWHKDELVTALFMTHGRTVLVTPAGTVASGGNDYGMLGMGDVRAAASFVRLQLPTGFSPDRVQFGNCATALMDGKRMVIAGRNYNGQLGIGRTGDITTFTEVPISVDSVDFHDEFSIFRFEDQLYLAGKPDNSLRRGGYLSENRYEYLLPTAMDDFL